MIDEDKCERCNTTLSDYVTGDMCGPCASLTNRLKLGDTPDRFDND